MFSATRPPRLTLKTTIEPALHQDWIAYLHPDFSSWQRADEHRQGKDSTTIPIPGTCFQDVIEGFEWHGDRRVRVFSIDRPSRRKMLLVHQCMHAWMHWGARVFPRKSLVDTHRCLLRIAGEADRVVSDTTLCGVALCGSPTTRCRQRLPFARVAALLALAAACADDAAREDLFHRLHRVAAGRRTTLINMKFDAPYYTPAFRAWKTAMAHATGEWTLFPHLDLATREMLQEGQRWTTMRDVPHELRLDRPCICENQLQNAFAAPTTTMRYLRVMTRVQTCPHAPDVVCGASDMTVWTPPNNTKRCAYMDVEWIPRTAGPQLYLVGVLVPPVYRAFWVPFLHWSEEWRVLQAVRAWLEDEMHIDHVISFCAEDKFLREWRERHAPLLATAADRAAVDAFATWWARMSVDAFTVVAEAPFVVRGSYTGRLKHLHGALFAGKWTTLPPLAVQCPEIQDGATSVEKARDLFWRRRDKTFAERVALRAALETYNRFDCEALAEVARVMTEVRQRPDPSSAEAGCAGERRP